MYEPCAGPLSEMTGGVRSMTKLTARCEAVPAESVGSPASVCAPSAVAVKLALAACDCTPSNVAVTLARFASETLYETPTDAALVGWPSTGPGRGTAAGG